MNRHKGLEFAEVQVKLAANTEKLWSLKFQRIGAGGMLDLVGTIDIGLICCIMRQF